MAQYVIFTINNNFYGLHIHQIKEIYGHMRINQVEGMEDYFCGLINLRGNILSVLDARTLMDGGASELTKSSKILIVRSGQFGGDFDELTGLLVDRVYGVEEIPESELNPVPPHLSAEKSDLLEAVFNGETAIVAIVNAMALLKVA